MIFKLQDSKIYLHIWQEYFSAYMNFFQPLCTRYLVEKNIKVEQRQSGSLQNNGIVEKSDNQYKSVFEKLEKENKTANIALTVERPSFFTNTMFGGSKLNEFQLVL